MSGRFAAPAEPRLLHSQAYSFGNKARLAISLAWVGGFVDAVGFFVLAGFVSNMTGNTAYLGARLADGQFHLAVWFAWFVLMFLAGAMLSGLLIESAHRAHARSIYTAALFVEALLLSAWAAVVWAQLGRRGILTPGTPTPAALALSGLPCVAMGLQNATITRIAGSVVRTTHVTGVVTDLGLETVQLIYWLVDRARRRGATEDEALSPRGLSRLTRIASVSRRHPTVQRLFLLASIWVSFAAGCVLGGLTYGTLRWGVLGLAGPIAFLLAMIFLDRLGARAAVHALDPTRRLEILDAHGVPESARRVIGLYRIEARGHAGGRIRLPDLGELHRQIPPAHRAVILTIDDRIALDANALHGLAESARHLAEQGQRLILATSQRNIARDARRSIELADLTLVATPGEAVRLALSGLATPGAAQA